MHTTKTIKYGPSESQVGDLYLPAAVSPPVVCLLHGGFWRMPYGRDEFSPVAIDLVTRGFAVWNIEYRRLGVPGGGWPGTLQDVAAAIDHLAEIAAGGTGLDLDRVTVVGHSAGGQLALWSAAGSGKRHDCRAPSRVHPIAAAGLAAAADLAGAYALGAGDSAVNALLGGSPDQYPDRYEAASPLSLLPLGVKQLLIHGTADEALPVELTRSYVHAARSSGDDVEYVELIGAGHMDYLDPKSKAHNTLCHWLGRLKSVLAGLRS